jgi:Transglycosylase
MGTGLASKRGAPPSWSLRKWRWPDRPAAAGAHDLRSGGMAGLANEVWFGRRSYGAAAAAKAYFGKSFSDLTLDEAAGIPGYSCLRAA